MPKIFDNLTPESQLGVALRDYFGGSYESLDVATGYLDLRGWGHLGDIIGGKPFAEGTRLSLGSSWGWLPRPTPRPS